jgi:hypothetical protein
MMTNKFTKGSEWITKGGWRAMVVDVKPLLHSLFVWHEEDHTTWAHSMDGVCDDNVENYNLDKPYTELRKGTVWVNVWKHREYDEIVSVAYDSEKEYLDELSQDRYYQCIASFKHDWTEGEKI